MTPEQDEILIRWVENVSKQLGVMNSMLASFAKKLDELERNTANMEIRT